jgi:hypothetical protein
MHHTDDQAGWLLHTPPGQAGSGPSRAAPLHLERHGPPADVNTGIGELRDAGKCNGWIDSITPCHQGQQACAQEAVFWSGAWSNTPD